MTLAMDMPVVTLVNARNKIIEMTAIDIETVFTLAASCRSVNMLSPRHHRPRAACSALSRKPERPKNSRMVPTMTVPVVM